MAQMKNKIYTYFFMVFATVLLNVSCIRDNIEICPPLVVELDVKDKNYFNVAAAKDFIQPKDENLPFRDYVSTLYYSITSLETGNVVETRNTFEVRGEEKRFNIVMPEDLPYGEYSVTVWGNLKSDAPLGDNNSNADMNDADAFNNDIYLCCDTVEYLYGKERHVLEMERAKGLLLIKVDSVPDAISCSTKNISNTFQVVSAGFRYSNAQEVETVLDWDVRNEIETHTLLCPSTGHRQSLLDVCMMSGTIGQDNDIVLNPSDVQITMGRNSITIVHYLYRPEYGDFSIMVLIDDNWEVVHGMEVD